MVYITFRSQCSTDSIYRGKIELPSLLSMLTVCVYVVVGTINYF